MTQSSVADSQSEPKHVGSKILQNLAVELGRITNMEAALVKILDSALSVEGVEVGGIYLFDQETGAFVLTHHRGLSEEFVGHTSKFDKESSQVKIILAGKPIYTAYEQLLERMDDIREKENLSAIGIIPILSEGLAVGAMNVASHKWKDIPESSRSTLETIASFIGPIIMRVKSEELLAKRERLYRTLLDTIPDTVVVVTTDFEIVMANSAAAETLRVKSTDELIGINALELIDPEDHEQAVSQVMLSLQKGSASGIAYRLVRRDGTRFFGEISSGVVNDEKGDPAYVISITRDITERKEAESSLQKANDDLEKSLRELQEIQEQLLKSEKLTLLGILSAGIGHELRNPLGAMKNSVYFLRMVLDNNESDVKESLDIIDNEIKTSEMIIGSLLDFTHPKKPTRKNVTIDDVLGDALSRIQLRPDIEIKLRIDPSIPTLLLDPVQMSRVFLNMIRNGFQAMPDGGQLCITAQLGNSNDVKITFEDSGIGIPKENIDRLFEPLFTTKAKGIGLGLAISKSFVKAHNGSIEVESQIDRGTTIAVNLPLPLMNGNPSEEDENEGRSFN